MNTERQNLLGSKVYGKTTGSMESYKINFLTREVPTNPINNGPVVLSNASTNKNRKHCIYMVIVIVVCLLIFAGGIVALVVYTHRDRGTSSSLSSPPPPSPLVTMSMNPSDAYLRKDSGYKLFEETERIFHD
jgi:hypothetical protein